MHQSSMILKQLDTPVLFLIFNRPDTAGKVFDGIRKARPRRLFVAADGPRADKPGEDRRCAETRSIIGRVDWDCEVKTLFRDKNLGCGKAVSSAIDWFFEQVEEGIILEDDCLPHPSFFTFCEAMLIRYRDNMTVWSVSGAHFSHSGCPSGYSYHFSALAFIWGWATWRNRWQHYVFDVRYLSERDLRLALRRYFRNGDMRRFWLWKFILMKNNRIDTWDYQFAFSLWLNGALALVADTNLISNIGFGDSATHTTDPNNKKANLPAFDIGDPPRPVEVRQDMDADEKLHIAENRLLKLKPFICRRIYLLVKTLFEQRP